jgi:hypothetical protein
MARDGFSGVVIVPLPDRSRFGGFTGHELRNFFSGSSLSRANPVGNRFRVFYEVDSALYEVQVLAVGVKDRNRLIIGGEEYAL